MIIPRFTIKTLLGLMVLAAFMSLILAQAVRGQSWAIGVCVGLVSLFVALAAHSLVFAIAWVLAQARRLLDTSPKARSPFASAGPPPQIIPPSAPP